MSRLVGLNGIWANTGQIGTANVDDAELVEFTLTSLCQPPRAINWRRTVEIIKAHYVKNGRPEDKAEKLGIERRAYFYRLSDAEKFLMGMLPPKV